MNLSCMSCSKRVVLDNVLIKSREGLQVRPFVVAYLAALALAQLSSAVAEKRLASECGPSSLAYARHDSLCSASSFVDGLSFSSRKKHGRQGEQSSRGPARRNSICNVATE